MIKNSLHLSLFSSKIGFLPKSCIFVPFFPKKTSCTQNQQPRDAGSKAFSKFSDRLSCRRFGHKGEQWATQKTTLEGCQALKWMNIGMNHVFCFNRFLVYSILKRATITWTKQLPTCCEATFEEVPTQMTCIKQTTWPMYLSGGSWSSRCIYKPIFGHLPCLCLKIGKQTCCHPHWRQPNKSKYLVKMLIPVCLQGPFETHPLTPKKLIMAPR